MATAKKAASGPSKAKKTPPKKAPAPKAQAATQAQEQAPEPKPYDDEEWKTR